jgi:hypothetical protein
MVMEMVSVEVDPVPPPTQSKFLTRAGIRYTVFWRDGFTCVYCGKSRHDIPNMQLHLDHVIPVSIGGTDNFDNLVTACAECNGGKWDSILSERLIAFIQTLIKQNNARFLELADKENRDRLEAVVGYSLGRKVVKVRWDGDDFLLIKWSENTLAKLKHLETGRFVTLDYVVNFDTYNPEHPEKDMDPNLVALQELMRQHEIRENDIDGFDEDDPIGKTFIKRTWPTKILWKESPSA